MSALKVELVAADRQVWQGEADMVAARSVEGDIGILPGHAPLLSVLVEGEIRIKAGGSTESVSIDGGFMSVDSDRVVIVADRVDAGGLTTAATN